MMPFGPLILQEIAARLLFGEQLCRVFAICTLNSFGNTIETMSPLIRFEEGVTVMRYVVLSPTVELEGYTDAITTGLVLPIVTAIMSVLYSIMYPKESYVKTLNDEEVFSDLGFCIPDIFTTSGPLLASKFS
jgi:hypothetical protein